MSNLNDPEKSKLSKQLKCRKYEWILQNDGSGFTFSILMFGLKRIQLEDCFDATNEHLCVDYQCIDHELILHYLLTSVTPEGA